jgi:hypothetical protein
MVLWQSYMRTTKSNATFDDIAVMPARSSHALSDPAKLTVVDPSDTPVETNWPLTLPVLGATQELWVFPKLSSAGLQKSLKVLEETLIQNEPASLTNPFLLGYALSAREWISGAEKLRSAGYGKSGQTLDFNLVENQCTKIMRALLGESAKLSADPRLEFLIQESFDGLFAFLVSGDSPNTHISFWLEVAKSDSNLASGCRGPALAKLNACGAATEFYECLNAALTDPNATRTKVFGFVSDLVAGGIEAIDLASAFHALDPVAFKRLHVALRNNLTFGARSPHTDLLHQVSGETLSLLSRAKVQ